jgi:hypothetical protein
VIWTAPNGNTYTTRPGSQLFFPQWSVTTAELPALQAITATMGQRGVMMPTRQRTRTADRLHRINAERSLNGAHVAERNRPPPF